MASTDHARQEWFGRARAHRVENILDKRGFKLPLGSKNERKGPCPSCGGTDRFGLNISKQTFVCHQCGLKGAGAIDIVIGMGEAKTPWDAAIVLEGPAPNGHDTSAAKSRLVGTWIYKDAEGKHYLRIDRYENQDGSKSYPQGRWDGTQWIKGKPQGPKIPYRLPELLDSDRSEPVWITEGEKCADAVAGLGLTATSASEGAGKWTADLNEHFRDRIAYILPDNDEQGAKHAKQVAQSLVGIAREVRIVNIPGLVAKEDVYDWIARGGTREKLDALGEAASAYARDSVRASISEKYVFLGDIPPTAPKELIKGLIPADGVAVTGGQSTAGKTFIQNYKAVCLATGKPYFGRRIVEKVGTVIIAAEGRIIMPNRFGAVCKKLEITDPLPILWPKAVPDFMDTDGLKLFISELKEIDKYFRGEFGVRLGMTVIDTVAACFAMKDEDDNSEATKVCNIMRGIYEETGSLMAPTQHYGKNADSGLRGASAWRGSADIVEGVLADIHPLTGKTDNRQLTCTKSRDGEQGAIAPFNLEFVELGLNEESEPFGSCCVVPKLDEAVNDATPMSKGKRAVRDAITEALDTRGEFIVPRAGMDPVKAARVTDVREEFDQRYVVDEKDPAKAANAKRMAFRRNIDLLSPSEFGAGSAEGTDWIWRIER
jgi:hypothetical protein